MKTLAMLHTGPVVIKPLNDLAKSILPELRIVNLLDDSIVAEIERSGKITDAVRNRLNHMGTSAREAGADAVLITCSSISEMAQPVEQHSGLPVYKIDEAMAESAVRCATRIGVVATLPTTLEPTCRQIEQKARDLGRKITLRRELCRDAFECLSRGDEKGHDRIVLDAVKRLTADHEVVVLAQASMARLQPQLDSVGVPVLTSPQLGVRMLRDRLVSAGIVALAS